MLEFVNDNPVIAGLVVAAIVGLTSWAWTARKDKQDSEAIYQFLVGSNSTTEFKFRSTEAIASNTGLSEKRVKKLCAADPRIKRNEKEIQTWKLT